MAQLVARGQATIVSQKDSYTITQSVGEYLFPAANDGKVTDAVSFVSTIGVMLGGVPVMDFTIGSVAKPAGFSQVAVDNNAKTITYSVAAGVTILPDSGVITIPILVSGAVYNLSFVWAKAKAGADGPTGTAVLPDWMEEWDSGKTQINGNYVITPKLFAGVNNANGTITGTAVGRFTMLTRNSSGQFQSEEVNGIYGFRDGYKTFAIDTSGSVELGRGDNAIKYNALTGKIEFGAAVSMQWAGAAWIDANGIFTGTLSAATVNAIAINASQITAGTINAGLLDVASLKSQLITAGNIEALTLNVTKGTIGGWSIDADSIYREAKNNTPGSNTAASGSVTVGSNGIRGYRWRLDSTGAGALAGGNIAWDVAGNVTFGSSVSLLWTTPISEITTALGGSSYPRMTYISSTGIYTGTLSAQQVNAVDIDASGIRSGYLCSDRIEAGSIGADKIDAVSLKANIINTDYINGLSCTFVRGSIGGWDISGEKLSSGGMALDSAARCILVSGDGQGLVRLFHKSGGDYGFEARNHSGAAVVIIGSVNRIAGWSFDESRIYKNNVTLGADGSVTGGALWQLSNDGSGRLAGGNISWDASGTLTFSPSVSLNWSEGINALTDALGGSSHPKLTRIDPNGIYTGTLTAGQVNAVAINASCITTGTLSADRIAAGSITVDKLNAASLQAGIVTSAYIEGLTLNFQKGTIGGWSIDSTGIYAGVFGATGAVPIQIRTASSGSGNWYSGDYRPMGVTLTWHQSGNAGHIVLGSIAASGSSVKTGFVGIQMMSHDGLEYFTLSANTLLSGSKEVYNRIAGWAFDASQIWKNNVCLGADGSIVNGGRWRLNNDGSGHIAGGNISWDANGNVTFDEAVAINWKNNNAGDISAIITALGGTGYPKLTKITSAGIYTGTVAASQIAVDSVLVVGGSSYDGHISVRDAGNYVKVILNRAGITAVAGEIGGWTLTSTSLYAGSIYLSSSGMIYNGSYWRLNNDGSGLLASNNINWDAAGNITMKNATIQDVTVKGSIRAPFVRVDGSIVINIGGSSVASRPDSEKYDNLCIIGGTDSGGWSLQSPSLAWTVDQSGRRLCLTHYRYNNEYVYGTVTFTAPAGQYFYENGTTSSTLKMSREVVELMGYGSSTQFYGWIVLNRRDLYTSGRYGAFGQYLAMGSVTVISSSNYSIKYKTYDGGVMSMTRNGTGLYTINMPWSLSTDSYMVMLSGKWLTGPVYGTIKSQGSTSFQVQTSDDSTANEGSFNFIIVSTADFK